MSAEGNAEPGRAAEHFNELDGLRGAAAFIVMFAHYWYFLHDIDNSAFGASPLGLFLNSKFAVYVFFALSGFVLAHASSRSRIPFSRLVVKRYVRLTLPILASAALALVLITLGLGSDAYRTELGPNAVSYFPPNFEPGIFASLYDTAIRVYGTGHSDLNAVLWTMRVELIGSILVFALYRFIPKRSYRLALNLIGATVMFLTLGKHHPISGLQLFCCGMILYDLWPELKAIRDRAMRGNVIGFSLFALGMALAAWSADEPTFPSVAPLFDMLRPAIEISRYEAYQTAAILALLGMLLAPACSRLFGSSLFRFLGLISFPLYLTHASIEVMITGHVFLWLQQSVSPLSAALILLIPNIALCILVAVLFLRLVEAPAIRISARSADWLPAFPRHRLRGFPAPWRLDPPLTAEPVASEPAKRPSGR
jgi:peptidoglycan/LPS O-acetylase OafA/YrhL